MFSLQGESQDGVTSSVLKKKSKDTKLLQRKRSVTGILGGEFHSQVPTPHRACFSREKVTEAQAGVAESPL